jgi:RHS repeat-associated protein
VTEGEGGREVPIFVADSVCAALTSISARAQAFAVVPAGFVARGRPLRSLGDAAALRQAPYSRMKRSRLVVLAALVAGLVVAGTPSDARADWSEQELQYISSWVYSGANRAMPAEASPGSAPSPTPLGLRAQMVSSERSAGDPELAREAFQLRTHVGLLAGADWVSGRITDQIFFGGGLGDDGLIGWRVGSSTREVMTQTARIANPPTASDTQAVPLVEKGGCIVAVEAVCQGTALKLTLVFLTSPAIYYSPMQCAGYPAGADERSGWDPFAELTGTSCAIMMPPPFEHFVDHWVYGETYRAIYLQPFDLQPPKPGPLPAGAIDVYDGSTMPTSGVPASAGEARDRIQAELTDNVDNYPTLVTWLGQFGLSDDHHDPAGPSSRELYGPNDSPATPNLAHCHKRDPVDCATGNFTETYDDLAIGGLGNLDLSRTYNSLGAAGASVPGRFGYGWSDSYGQRLAIDTDSDTATVIGAEGAEVAFYANGDGTYDHAPWVQATLRHDSDGTYDYTLPDRSSLRFGDTGRLIERRDRNDNVTDLDYDGSGRVASVTAPGGRSIAFAYNTDGTVASATSTAGREVHYGYTAGALTSVTDVRGGEWQFSYDSSHRITDVEDPRGHHTINAYDSSDRVVTQTDRRGHDTTWVYNADTTTVTEPEGRVTEMTFEHNLPTQIIAAKGTAEEATKHTAYDADANPIAVTDGRGHDWHYTYDAAGNRTSATDPLDRETTWTYDSQHDVLSHTLPSGLTTTHGYDAHGNITSITRPLSPTQDQITRLHYDGAGNVTSRTDPLSHTWTYTYNAHGDLTGATSPLEHETSYTHDDDGFVTTKVSPRGHLPGADPADFTTTYEHNEAGQPTTTTDPLGHDATFAYDANGNQTSTTDADGRQTQTTYDADDHPASVERGDGSTLHTGYDDNGLVVSQTDGEGHETSYARDHQGRVASVADPNDRTTSYAYDDAGNRTSVTDPDDRATSYTYDDADQLTGIHYSSGTPGDVTLSYTDDGLRSTMTDDTGTSTWTYDPLDRLAGSENGRGQTVGYHYDLANRLTSIDYPDALVPGPSSETPDTVAAGTVTRGYDDDDRLTSVQDWLSHTTTFEYNVDDVLTTIEQPDGTTATQTVDRNDQLTAIDDTGDNYSYSVDYTRTNAELLASATETGDGAGPDATYAHDDAARLTSSGTGNQAYTYDAADNLTQLTDATDTRKQAFDDANQLTAIIDASDQPVADLDFSPEGNRTALTLTSGTATSYRYDQANQLTQYEGPDAAGTATITQGYGYAGDGLRQYTETSGTRTHHTWDRSGGVSLMIQDGATSYVYGPGGAVIEQITAAGQSRYYHHDQLGSVRALTDTDGQPVATYDYAPYGTLRSSTGTATNPFRYAGQYTDPTGLQYLRARYYDSATGQFLTRDPLEATTRQAYAYAGGAPTELVDLAGQFPGLPSFQQIADSAAGFGDMVTFGGTKAIRELIGSDGTNYCSGAYTGGEVSGMVAGLALGGAAAAARGAGEAGSGVAGVIRGYTRHGLAQAIQRDAGRGVAPRAILDAVRSPVSRTIGADGATTYTGSDAVVVVNEEGRVITTYARNSTAVRSRP